MEDKYGITLSLLGFFNAIAKNSSREGKRGTSTSFVNIIARGEILSSIVLREIVPAKSKEEIFFGKWMNNGLPKLQEKSNWKKQSELKYLSNFRNTNQKRFFLLLKRRGKRSLVFY